MKKILQQATSLSTRWWAAPLALLGLALAAYAIFIFQSGFYWDDLPISWIAYQLDGPLLARYFSDSRPIWAYLYQLTIRVFPQQPVYWQFFALFWRWLCAVALWQAALALFPKRRDVAFFLSAATLLYTGFNQQWVSFVYAHFFIVMFFFLFSWLLMLRGNTLLGCVLSALNLWMFEYFFILDLIRPLLLWVYFRDDAAGFKDRAVKVFKKWLPYLAVFILSILYRTFVFSHTGFGYSLKDELVRAPLETSAQLLKNIALSVWVSAVSAWGYLFKISNINTDGPRISLLYALVLILAAALSAWHLWGAKNQESAKGRGDAYWLIGLGLAMLMFAGVPFWLTNLPVTLGFPANRALLSFMFGSCFLLAGLAEFIPARIRNGLFVALIALAAGRQFLWANEFRRDWAAFKNMFWQMTWRAPGLKPDTAVLMNENLLYYADNSLGAALNWIYAPGDRDDEINFALFYPTNRGSLRLEKDLPVKYDFLAGEFNGNTSQVAAFYYAPPKCLRLLDPEIDSVNHLIPDDTLLRDAALLSNATLVLTKPVAQMPSVFGPEPAHTWCYYFQKADLARQMKDWNRVVDLGNTAFHLSDHPNDPVERFVFIEGSAHAGDWKKAVEYSLDSYRVSKNYVGPLLCKLWLRIERETQPTNEQQAAVLKARHEFNCAP